jgi:Na+-translocating ferredoxin:NAD+ oxidoreductase RnfG subunit
MAIKAKHNHLIDQLLEDPRYCILQYGIILKGKKPVGFSRKGELAKRGKAYRYLRYKGVDLKIHRIIYRKFAGKLLKTKVIHHKDNNGLNNHINNLAQVTQSENMFFKNN